VRNIRFRFRVSGFGVLRNPRTRPSPPDPDAPNPKLETRNSKPSLWPSLVLACCLSLISACGTVSNQVTPSTVFSNLSLEPGQLRQHGVALLTPATVTGQEEDKQTLALIFAETVRVQLPETRVVTLPEALGAINRAGLANDYRRMLEDYRDTGVLERDGLRRVGQAVGVRYLVLLKLASFNQDMRERFSIFGLRLFQTLYANIRLYVQLWDSDQGIIAWEAVEELHYAYDSGAERPVTFRVAVEEAARQLIARLP